MPKIYKDKICGYQLEYTVVGSKIGIKREDENNFQYIDLQIVGLDFVWDGTKLGIKKGYQSEYQYLDVGGANLEYNWNGYELGVRQEGETNYIYQNLRGASIEYNWNGTKLGIKTTDDSNFTYTELKGEQGNPNVLTIGSVNIVSHDKGNVEITGTAPSQILNIDLPVAPPTTFSIGTVGEDENFSVNITGTAPNQKLNFLLKRGNDLEFNWDNTKLGVRSKGNTEYIYTDLKGEPGEVTKIQLDNAMEEIREEIDDKIGDIDLSEIASVPYGSVFYYPATANIPDGYITRYSPQLEVEKYPHLVPIFGVTNLIVGDLELNLTSNTSDSDFKIEYNGTPPASLSTSYYYLFDGNLNTSYSFGDSTGWSQPQLKISGEKAKRIKKQLDKLNTIYIRIRGSYTNNDIYARNPSISLSNTNIDMESGTWLAPAGGTINFDVLLKVYHQFTMNITESEYLDMTLSVYKGVLNIHEIEFKNVPIETENSYIDIPMPFSPYLGIQGGDSGPVSNDDMVTIMYVGKESD